MIKIGITGGIGSGKSFVCQRLQSRGVPVYNCDAEAKRLMTESGEIVEAVKRLVGNDAYTAEGRLNRERIAAFLFLNEENARKINAIVHPAVKKDFLAWAERQDSDIVAQECAILFESGFDDTVDMTVEVYAPQPLRIRRAMRRDSATEQQIEARMAQQMDEEEKCERADVCIMNDEVHDTDSEIERMLAAITGHATHCGRQNHSHGHL